MVGGGLALAAIVAAFVVGSGHFIPDSRFDLFWNPRATFGRNFTIWDGNRGLGVPLPDFTPVLSGLLVLVRGCGISAAGAERLLHVALLTFGGMGAVLVLRCWRRRVGIEHLLVGALYMFNPYTATYLVPSLLFVNFVFAPWFLLAFVRGARGQRPWRWVAIFALLVFTAGFGNVPGLLLAMLPILPAAWYLIVVERSASIGTVVRWFTKAAALTVLVCASAMFKTAIGSGSLQLNLGSTESPQTTTLASSWSESWRGLGFWVSYFGNAFGLVKPGTVALFDSAPIVLATFAAPIAALVVLWRARVLSRLAFAAILLISLVVMTGAFPFDSPSPFGRILLDLYDASPTLYGFRNTYKAGAGLVLGVALLCGLGAGWLWKRLVAHRSTARRLLVVAVLMAMVAAASTPFWSGSLYAQAGVDDVPSYYRAAFSWLDRQPGNSRVLVLPGTGFTLYRWGRPGDDIIDSGLDRPHVVRSPLATSGAEAEGAIDALNDRFSTGAYTPGTLAPLARRLGIEYVMVRNDLDWQRLQTPRPLAFQGLRTDPSLRRVHTFGRPGENVLSPDDDRRSSESKLERSLPPVEIYRVPNVPGAVRTVRADRSIVVSGDGTAMVTATQFGDLPASTGMRFSGDLTADELARALASGSELVVTDSNRYRQTGVGTFGPTAGRTLAASETPPRGVTDLFQRPGSRSMTNWGDARIVSVSTIGQGASFGSGTDPTNAFDGDPTTAWLTGALTTDTGQRLRVEFSEPTLLSSATLLVADPCCGGRRVRQASLHFSDGSSVTAGFRIGLETTVRFEPRRVRWVDVVVDRTTGGGNRPIGFSEIRLAARDVRPYVRMPDDAFRLASTSPRLDRALTTAPTRYLVDRATGTEAGVALLRQFRTAGTRDYDLSGTLQLAATTSDDVIDRIAGRPVGATSTTRAGSALDASAIFAVDGDPQTSWAGQPTEGTALTVRFPRTVVSDVEIVIDRDGSTSVPDELEVTAGAQRVTVPTPDACRAAGSLPNCVVRVPLAPVSTDELTVGVTRITGRLGLVGDLPIRVREVTIDNRDNQPVNGTRPTPCVDVGFVVDRTSVPVTIDADLETLVSGAAVPFHSCTPVELGSGWQTFDSGTQVSASRVELATTGAGSVPSGTTPRARVTVTTDDPTRVVAVVHAPRGGATLVLNRSFDDRWVASTDHHDLGPAASIDGQAAWKLPSGVTTVEMRFRPQRTYVIAMVLSGLGLLVCVALVIGPPRRRRVAASRPNAHHARRGRPRRLPDALAFGALVAFGFLFAGLPGAMVAAAGFASERLLSPRVPAFAAVVLLVVAAIATVTEGTLAVDPGFASSRPIAWWCAAMAAVLALVAVAGFARSALSVAPTE